MNIVVRVFLLLAGAIFAASVAVAAAIGISVWGVRAAWYKLTGRPVSPFIVRFRSPGFAAAAARPAESRTPRADAVGQGHRREGDPFGRGGGDVTDVEIK